MPKQPKLSVIIASYNSEKTIKKCLLSLENQTMREDFEVIVVNSATDGTAKLVEDRFPEVNLYGFPERKFPGDARNFGISVAKAGIIAFIDADCIANKNWVEEILKAHESPCPVIGGAIANGNPDSYIGWAAYFCEFSQWMPNIDTRWLTDIPTANISYKREVFEKYGYFVEGTYCSDTEFHWRLGHRLLFAPSILVCHQNIDNLRRFLIHEFDHGKSFAQVRVMSQNFSILRRFIYAIFSPFILLKLFMVRGLINLKNRIYLVHYLKALPILTLGLTSWTIGESVGYVKGKRRDGRLIR